MEEEGSPGTTLEVGGGALRRLAVEPRVSEVDGESDSAQQGDPQSEQQKQNGLSRFARPAVRP